MTKTYRAALYVVAAFAMIAKGDTLFGPNVMPSTIDSGDNHAVELGTKIPAGR
jgi:hypothetical protein